MITEKIRAERAVADTWEKNYALFCGRASAGLFLYLKACNIVNRYIIVPDNICAVVPYSICLSGNYPFFVDIDSNGAMDIGKLEEIDNPEIAAVICAYIYGNNLDWPKLKSICEKRKWFLLEDISQAVGTKYQSKYVGSFADATILSFGKGKHIDMAYGGVLLVNDDGLYKEAKKLSSRLPLYSESDLQTVFPIYTKLYASHSYYPHWDEYIKNLWYSVLVFNTEPCDTYYSKLVDEIKKIEERNGQILFNVSSFKEKMPDAPFIKPLIFSDKVTYWRFNILVSTYRDELMEYLKSNHIKASKYFPACHRFFTNDNLYPNSISMEEQILNLWVMKETCSLDIERICVYIERFFDNCNYEQFGC